MFPEKLKVNHHKELVNGKNEREYIEIQFFSPNGEQLRQVVNIGVASIPALLEELKKHV